MTVESGGERGNPTVFVPKAVTILAGARDHFQLPLALHEASLLEALVTDLYWPADKTWFRRTAGRLMSHPSIEKRYRAGLASDRVRLSTRAFAAFALMKLSGSTRLNAYKGTALSRAGRQLALDTGAALFAYSTYAVPAFSSPNSRLPFRFLFQMHPHPAAAREILQQEMELVPFARASLSREYEFILSERDYELLCLEPALANGWVVASSYTASTLAKHGISRNQIHVVPYGVDTDAFPRRARPPAAGEPFRIVYVGSMIQRKGLSYLLDAIRMLRTTRIQLVLCGRGEIDYELLSHYSDVPVKLRLGESRDELVRIIQASDVFVLPSLTEGFAHVILETMACGVPVITTENTCAADVMRDGEHGFIVPIRDSNAVADRLTWAMEHRDEMAGMGHAAAEQAGRYTWSRFRAGVRDAYRRMLDAT